MTERSPNEDRAFAELRQLIVGPEQDTLAALRERVEDRQRRVEDVGEVLPKAAARCAEDTALADEAQKTADERNKKLKAEAKKTKGAKGSAATKAAPAKATPAKTAAKPANSRRLHNARNNA